ncbi:MAG: hypothetical protein KGJ70_06975, partial [Gemmatimonadota bacterium]|nr:hypothetical protein [Gemmatimonadota bacterium]
MSRPVRLLALPVALALAACRRQPPAQSAASAPPPPPLPAGFGVRVAAAAADTLHVRFTVTVRGTLRLGIQAPMFAMRPDSTLLLATPATLLVTNQGTGSAVIAAADSGVELVATPVDTATTAATAVRGRVVSFARPDTTRRLTLAVGAPAAHP